MENLKILHVVNISFVLPYYIGDQFDYFQKKGVIFSVACTPSTHFFEYAEVKRFDPISVEILREINVIEDIKSIIKLYKKIKQEGFDIVICHTPKGALIGLLASFLARVPKRIYFRHGIMYETSKGVKRKLLKGIEKLSGHLATKVVCVSDSVLKKSNKEGLSSAKKNIILNKGTCNGIDTDLIFNKEQLSQEAIISLRSKLKINSETKVLGYIGRLVNDKGINELVDAWKIIKNKYQNVVLLLVGPFEERDSLPNETIEYIMAESTILNTGLITDPAPYYALMDVMILPSYREGFPTVVLEASAMEVPVITTLVTGCRDSIVEGVTGIFTRLDQNDIAKSIMYYFDNPNIAQQHGINGRKWVVDNFNQKVIWSEIENNIIKK